MFKWRGDGDETYPSGVKLPRKTSYNALNISISSSSHQESILFILRLPFTCRHLLTKKDVSIIAPVTLQVNVKLLYGGREKIRMTTFYHVYRNTSTRPVQVQLPRTRTRCLQAITRRQKGEHRGGCVCLWDAISAISSKAASRCGKASTALKKKRKNERTPFYCKNSSSSSSSKINNIAI